MAVLNPLKVVITNYPEENTEWLKAENNPEDESAGIGKFLFQGNYILNRKILEKKPTENFLD